MSEATPVERTALSLLDAMERRALDEAQALLAPGFVMVFPGPARYASLAEMVAGASGRYRSVAKLVEDVESFESGAESGAEVGAGVGGKSVVFVRGTLYGVNSHGAEFAGVRFIDRFVVAGGLIERQDVWNDLAESGVLARRP